MDWLGPSGSEFLTNVLTEGVSQDDDLPKAQMKEDPLPRLPR